MTATLANRTLARLLGAMVLVVSGASALNAQDTRATDARAQVQPAITLAQTRSIDFGLIIPGPNGINRIVMPPVANPVCQEINGAIHSGLCQSGVFEGRAQAGAQVTMTLSDRSVRLTGPTRQTLLLRFINIGSGPGVSVDRRNGRRFPATVTDPGGLFTFYVGGDIWPTADQDPGVYTGTFDIEVDYQ